MSENEPALEHLQTEIGKAQAALLQVVASDPTKWWNAHDLREEARNGSSGDVMMFALTDLVNRQELRINSRLEVRAK